MMVKQIRHIFDLCEIKGVRLVCNYRDEQTEHPCDGEAIYPLDKRKGWKWSCPKCGAEWKSTFANNMPPEMRTVSAQEAAAHNLLSNIETLLGPVCAPFTVRFEIDGEEEKS